MRTVNGGRWFAFAELSWIWLMGILVYIKPDWWPALVILAFIPLFQRMLGIQAFRRTGLEPVLVLFLLSGGMAVWAAYNRQAAGAKFGVLLIAVFLFYALYWQTEQNFSLVAGLAGSFGGLLSIWFLLTHDWQVQPADLGVINTMGMWWMAHRPAIAGVRVHPNLIGGLAVILLPFPLAQLWASPSKWLSSGTAFSLIGASLTLIGLVASSSRAAWLALGVSLAVGYGWLASRRISNRVGLSKRLFWVSIGFLGLAAGTAGLWFLGRAFSGDASAITREAIALQTLKLIGDFPLTGAGLHAFPGIYSQFIAVIPHFLFDYSHNLYLDVALEQGVPGLVFFLILLVVSMLQLARSKGMTVQSWAVLTAMGASILHGFLDDPLYGGGGTFLLFFLPGMALALAGERATMANGFLSKKSTRQGLMISLTVLVVGGSMLWRKPLFALGEANLGAVELSRIALRDFPSEAWDEGENMAAYGVAQRHLEIALAFNPENRTALHRLAWLAMLRRDFPIACQQLSTAHALDPQHRGIRKLLGYCETWLGEMDQAAALLASIPEAQGEMSVYTWWWGTQERPDLVSRAAQMADRLAGP